MSSPVPLLFPVATTVKENWMMVVVRRTTIQFI
jgi:hypothetical protein